MYFRDSGLLHGLLSLTDTHALLGHPRVGASWEGFALKQLLRVVGPAEAFFWVTHSGAEIDLYFVHRGRRYGAELKLTEAPKITKSMRTGLDDLGLDHLWIVYPGSQAYPVDDRITVWPLQEIGELSRHLQQLKGVTH